MDGLLVCAKYAFAPNRLKYCGPDKNWQLLQYCISNHSDPGLEEILKNFEVLYPYLKLIAYANNIPDPFDPRVVEAYWIGNRLLEKVSPKDFYNHLIEEQKLNRRLDKKSLKWILAKLPAGAKIHHSFHVLNIFKRTGWVSVDHTIESMNDCRVSWGEVVQVGKQTMKVKSRPIVYESGKLKLAEYKVVNVNFAIGDSIFNPIPKIGDLVSFHWGWLCQKISASQAKNLERYTKESLFWANQTV